jgi:hypothetical protein
MRPDRASHELRVTPSLPSSRTGWPWPGDSREDRAKRVALAYRHRLAELDPSAAAELDEQWAELGAGWVAPAPAPLDLDAWHSAGEMAELLHIDPQYLRDWARRKHIRVIQDTRKRRLYCVGDVVAYMRKARLRRVSATMQP